MTTLTALSTSTRKRDSRCSNGGHFTIDSNGDYHEATNSLPANKFNLKIRLQGQNGIAALLPPRALAQVGLPEKPDWLNFYEDKADSVTHKVSWGFFYNDIGDPRRAIDYLESAYSEKPDAPRVVFELTFAYNALGRASRRDSNLKERICQESERRIAMPGNGLRLPHAQKLQGGDGAVPGVHSAAGRFAREQGLRRATGDKSECGLRTYGRHTKPRCLGEEGGGIGLRRVLQFTTSFIRNTALLRWSAA